mmetsp:Transcript_9605/g.28434  ORF Transcript_9605/g.28434 Transcript_9605/m.28434 type:complete len:200 (-) Transcript_9605:1049-1648(-)
MFEDDDAGYKRAVVAPAADDLLLPAAALPLDLELRAAAAAAAAAVASRAPAVTLFERDPFSDEVLCSLTALATFLSWWVETDRLVSTSTLCSASCVRKSCMSLSISDDWSWMAASSLAMFSLSSSRCTLTISSISARVTPGVLSRFFVSRFISCVLFSTSMSLNSESKFAPIMVMGKEMTMRPVTMHSEATSLPMPETG